MPGGAAPADANRPWLTVVTVVRDGAAHLEQAMASVIAQKTAGIEYLLVDGASRDNTLAIVRRLAAGVDHWQSEPDRGIYDAMNKGLARARGRYVAFLNADDWYEPGFLEALRLRLQAVPAGAGEPVVYCDSYVFDESLTTEWKRRRPAVLQPGRGMTVPHQGMFVPRAWYEKLGGYSLEYRFAADYDLLLRLLAAGARFEKLDVTGVNFRSGGASTRHMNRSIGEVSRIVRRHAGTCSRAYLRFLLQNRLPSLLGTGRRLLERLLGASATRRLRRWRQRVGRGGGWVPAGGAAPAETIETP